MKPDTKRFFLQSSNLRIAAFMSHPTQHHAPWFRALAIEDNIDLKVFYFSRHGIGTTLDKEFGERFKWDISLTDGYNYEYLPTVLGLKSTYNGFLRINRGIRRAIKSKSWHAILNLSYNSIANWVVWNEAILNNIPQIYHSDSTLLHKRSLWRVLFKELPVRVFFKGISIFLASGDNNYEYLRRYGAHPKKITPCPIPVDIERFQDCMHSKNWESKRNDIRNKYHLVDDEKIILFCGKIAAWKKPQDIISAVSQLGLTKVKVLFIGTGPLADQIKRSLPDKVIVTGFINQSEIPYYLGVGDVLVMPSLRDQHPLAITEAACLGIPSIISDRCGCYGPNDVLRHGENGFVYPYGDTKALAMYLRYLLLDNNLKLRMGERAKELALTQNVDVAAKAVVKALKSYVTIKA